MVYEPRTLASTPHLRQQELSLKDLFAPHVYPRGAGTLQPPARTQAAAGSAGTTAFLNVSKKFRNGIWGHKPSGRGACLLFLAPPA